MMIDYDKQLSKWNIWSDDSPPRMLAKVGKVMMRVPSTLVVEDGPSGPKHGWLITLGQLKVDGDTAIIKQEI